MPSDLRDILAFVRPTFEGAARAKTQERRRSSAAERRGTRKTGTPWNESESASRAARWTPERIAQPEVSPGRQVRLDRDGRSELMVWKRTPRACRAGAVVPTIAEVVRIGDADAGSQRNSETLRRSPGKRAPHACRDPAVFPPLAAPPSRRTRLFTRPDPSPALAQPPLGLASALSDRRGERLRQSRGRAEPEPLEPSSADSPTSERQAAASC